MLFRSHLCGASPPPGPRDPAPRLPPQLSSCPDPTPPPPGLHSGVTAQPPPPLRPGRTTADHTPSQQHLTYSPQATRSPAAPSLPPETKGPRGAPPPDTTLRTLCGPRRLRVFALSQSAEKAGSKEPSQTRAELCLDASFDVTEEAETSKSHIVFQIGRAHV